MEKKQNAVDVHAIVFQEGDWWSAQCLEYDIAAQAHSLSELRHEIERVLTAHVVLAKRQDREPFAGMRRAPEKFWEMYERARLVPNSPDDDTRREAVVPHLRIVDDVHSNF